MSEFLDGKYVIYQGHVKDVDIFQYLFPFSCPTCGASIRWQQETCGDQDVTEEFFKINKLDVFRSEMRPNETNSPHMVRVRNLP